MRSGIRNQNFDTLFSAPTEPALAPPISPVPNAHADVWFSYGAFDYAVKVE